MSKPHDRIKEDLQREHRHNEEVRKKAYLVYATITKFVEAHTEDEAEALAHATELCYTQGWGDRKIYEVQESECWPGGGPILPEDR